MGHERSKLRRPRNMAAPAPNFEMYWNTITIEFVENNCRRPSVYCGRCAEFYDVDAFVSSESTGQRRARVRYCSAGKPAAWPETPLAFFSLYFVREVQTSCASRTLPQRRDCKTAAAASWSILILLPCPSTSSEPHPPRAPFSLALDCPSHPASLPVPVCRSAGDSVAGDGHIQDEVEVDHASSLSGREEGDHPVNHPAG